MTFLLTQDYILSNDSIIMLCDLRGRSAATRLLRLWVWISPGHGWMSLVSVLCCQSPEPCVYVFRCNNNSLHLLWVGSKRSEYEREKEKKKVLIITNNELWVSGLGLIKLTSEMLPGGTEKSHVKQVSRPKLEPVTSGIHVTKFSTWAKLFGNVTTHWRRDCA